MRWSPVRFRNLLSWADGVDRIFVALLERNAGLVMANAKTHALALGDFTGTALVALLGLWPFMGLQARVPGAILWAILLATAWDTVW